MRQAPSAISGHIILLAWLPMALATIGAAFDERRALGFTTWRSACRAAGLSPSSIATFTLELLPTAVIGALAGGVLALGVGLMHRRTLGRPALAAHAGCAAAMPIGLLLCASTSPWPLTLVAEALLAAFAGLGLWWLTRIRNATYARSAMRGMSRIPRAAGSDENFSVTKRWNPHDCH
jgi:hypothetical protein